MFSPLFQEMVNTRDAGGSVFDVARATVYNNIFHETFGGIGAIDVGSILESPETFESWFKYDALANMVGNSKHGRWMISYLYKRYDAGGITQDEWLDLAYEYMARTFLNGPMDFLMAQRLFKKGGVDKPGRTIMEANFYRTLFQQSQVDLDEILLGRQQINTMQFTPGRAVYSPNFKWYPHGPTVAPGFVGVEDADQFFARATVAPATHGDLEVRQRFATNYYHDTSRMMASGAWKALVADAVGGLVPNVDTSFMQKSYFSASCVDVPMADRLPCMKTVSPGAINWWGNAGDRSEYEQECADAGCCWEVTNEDSVPYWVWGLKN